jgi:hypothetical protein
VAKGGGLIKYKASYHWEPRIIGVEITRETKSSVFFLSKTPKGSELTERKFTTYHRYFDTFEEAKAFLAETYQRKVDSKRRELEVAKSYLGNVKGMKDNDQDRA